MILATLTDTLLLKRTPRPLAASVRLDVESIRQLLRECFYVNDRIP
jgi:hypothetical protein